MELHRHGERSTAHGPERRKLILNWDLHVDREFTPGTLPGFHSLLEIHALHDLTNAGRTPLSVGGLNDTNLGTSDVAGNSVFWGDLGFRWKLTPY